MKGSNLRFLIAFAFAFFAMPALIAATDPLGWWSGKPRELVWTYSREDRTMSVETLIRLARTMPADKMVVGTSYVGRGIDTCGTDFDRLWLPGLRSEEAGRVVAAGLSAGKTIVVDFAAIASLGELDYGGRAYYGEDAYIFNPRHVAALLGYRPHPKACRAMPPPDRGAERFQGVDAREDASDIAATQEPLRKNVDGFLTAVLPVCETSGSRLHIVQFPILYADGTKQTAWSFAQRAETILADIVRVAGKRCEIGYTNLALAEYRALDEMNAQHDLEDWYNKDHFNAELGRGYLQALSGALNE